MTIEDLKERNLIIFECIVGSRGYGLDLPTSDTDIKGVFILPEDEYYGLNYIEQVSDEKNDIVYYELKRFVDLLLKNNPTLIEMLGSTEKNILYKDSLFDQFTSELFLSKLCKNTFANYAIQQVKKAKGLNKKIVNPVDKERKNILNFCYIQQGQGAITLNSFLKQKDWKQENCGLVNVPHMRDLYALFYDEQGLYKGIMRKDIANEVLLSSVSEEAETKALLFFNKDGYTKYCKDYKEYWEWVEKRNEVRYANTVSHAKNYDAKNMMHTFRLLDMAIEILEQGKIIVYRPNREELLNIRQGVFEYDDLVQKAEEKIQYIEKAYENSVLPEEPIKEKIEKLLINVRKEYYLR